jgi:hypothetical protein
MPISGVIPQQAFEQIRDRIGLILATEFASQFALSSGTTPNPTVYTERFIQFDLTEAPAVNVSLQRGDYSLKDPTQVDGTYVFNIEAYATAKATGTVRGDYTSTKSWQRILGMVRAILENPLYSNLGFSTPYLAHTEVGSIQALQPANNNDAVFEAQGMLQFTVRVPEDTILETANDLLFSGTIVRLYNTDIGYYWGDGSAQLATRFVEELTADYFILE